MTQTFGYSLKEITEQLNLSRHPGPSVGYRWRVAHPNDPWHVLARGDGWPNNHISFATHIILLSFWGQLKLDAPSRTYDAVRKLYNEIHR